MARKFSRLSFLLLAAPCILARDGSSSSSFPSSSAPSTSGIATPSVPSNTTSVSLTQSAPSSTAPSSSASASPSTPSSSVTNSSSVSTQTGPLTIPISTYPFTPFPTPTLLPEPPLFPETDPLYPPPVSSDPVVVPDFAPAWSIAYSKAQALVRVIFFAN